MIRTLVTGGTGFIGSHLVGNLVTGGYDVTVLDNLQSGAWSNLDACASRIHAITGDVRDVGLVDRITTEFKPEFIFHLAANASVPKSVEQPLDDFDVNTRGTVVLLDAVRRICPQARVVLASSGAVYGEPKVLPICETSPIEPISPYGASKASAEVEARAYCRVYKVNVVIARIFNTYGPRMPRFIVLDFLRKLRDRTDVLEVLGSGQQVRDFNYVDDTVAGLRWLAEKGVAGESYNIASGCSCSVAELAERLLSILGLKDRTKIEFTGTSWPGDAQHWEVEIGKIRSLGYAPKTGLDDGLRGVVEWFRDRQP